VVYFISLYISLAIFIIGLAYKTSTWFFLKTSADSKSIPTSKRVLSAIKGISLTILSPKILTLAKVFLLDCILQRKLLKEDFRRWSAHVLIYWAVMLLLLMHALDTFVTSAIFPDYYPTLNPFMFLRDLFGASVLIGICITLYRRLVVKPARVKTNFMDWYAIILLAVIILSGIFLEGTKIGSYSIYKQMVSDYAGIEEQEEDFKALTAFWVEKFDTVAPDMEEPLDIKLIESGREIHETNCADCHSRPQWAFAGYATAVTLKGVALTLDRAGVNTFFLYIHFLACFIALAYLPFSKFLHILTSPLSLLANSVMDKNSEPANIATKQALGLDACMHCGQCTSRCSVGAVFEELQNVNMLPSERMQSLKKVVTGKRISKEESELISDGAYLCTNCHRCTDACPAGINLEDLWFHMRENLFQKGYPVFSVLSPLSFHRGLMRPSIPQSDYLKPITRAKEAVCTGSDLIKDRDKPLAPASAELGGRSHLLLSNQGDTFSACFGCQTCTNVCPIVANYETPQDTLGLLPHQIMHAAGLGMKDLILGSNMLWDCVTCYQCQEHCPQGVKVTEILYELKNLAIRNVAEKGIQ